LSREASHGFWPDRVIGLDCAAVVEQHLVQEEQTLGDGGDFRHIVEIALNSVATSATLKTLHGT
jgi:hypothetical protein